MCSASAAEEKYRVEDHIIHTPFLVLMVCLIVGVLRLVDWNSAGILVAYSTSTGGALLIY